LEEDVSRLFSHQDATTAHPAHLVLLKVMSHVLAELAEHQK
jgi:hypothetical protein